MRNLPPTNAPSAAIGVQTLSWACFAVLAAALLYWIVWFPFEGEEHRLTLGRLRVALPAVTVFFLEPWWRVPLIAALVGMASLALQALARDKRLSLAGHLAALAVCCGAFLAYRWAALSLLLELARNG